MSVRTVGRTRGWRLLLGVGLVLAVPGVAQAATTWTVNTTADTNPPGCTGGQCSLRQALAASAGGDTIAFDPALNGQTITLTNNALTISHSLTISGPGAGNLTIDGNNHDVVFSVNTPPTDDVTISGLTVTHGAQSGIGTLGGGGIFGDTVRTLTLDGDVITGNTATINNANASGGGGVWVNGGTLTVSSSTIDNNIVTLTGAGGNSNGGGGVYSNGGEVDVSDSDVSNNTVHQSSTSGSSGGGGIYSNGGLVDLTNTTVRNNTVTIDASNGGFDGGGGIYSNGGGVTLEPATINGNSFTISGGTANDTGGGGVYENGGDVFVTTSSIDGNAASVKDTSAGGFDGGGGLFSDGGEIGVLDSSISNNTATVDSSGDSNGGGGVFDDEGLGGFYLTSTLSGNTVTLAQAATDNGGGAVRAADTVLVSNATIAGNRINADGGAIVNDEGTTFKDTILADNGADNCAGVGSFSSAGFNLESTNTCGLNNTGDLVNTNPHLGPLQNNGGSTPTQALPAGSPAVDAGTCSDILGDPLSTDQRGTARPQPGGGQCDIGAYELVQSGGSPPPPPPPPSAPGALPGTPTATSSTGASFSGSVNPQGQATTTFFQYGIDARFRPGGATGIVYDQSTPPQSLPADATPHAVAASVSGLIPNALYHVRLVASNATGTTFGPDQTFTTPADPAPPPPVLGQSVDVKPVSGQVFVLVGTKLVPLTEGERLPSGAVLDTRNGSLQLTAATGKGRGRQTGVFGGAIFKLTQVRTGLTNLSLKEGALKGAPTYATCKAHKAGEATAAAVSSKTLQLLHANAHGKFRTSGRYAAATVRGTKWTTADRCDGTRIHVAAGSVAVSDFVRHKTIILHAGQSYLARLLRPG